jgi:peptidoglycan-associated lipoprotein
MMREQRLLVYGFMLVVVMFLVACGPATNPPPPKWTVENKNAPSETAQGASQKASQRATRESPSESSLEAMRKGQSTATPASSPLKDVYFGFDSSDLQPDARATLKSNAAWLKTNPAVRIQIEGHCDERGTQEYNLALGAKRAQSAKDYLVTLGIAADRLAIISYGEEVPVCTEHNESCWQKNRRDRFVIISGRPTS